jgi:hypothetical protein
LFKYAKYDGSKELIFPPFLASYNIPYLHFTNKSLNKHWHRPCDLQQLLMLKNKYLKNCALAVGFTELFISNPDTIIAVANIKELQSIQVNSQGKRISSIVFVD